MTAALGQDVIVPTKITHGLDFGDLRIGPPDEFGYFYNFLTYEFEEGGKRLTARHYLDDPDHASLLAEPDSKDEFAIRVLIFLAMRFGRISAFDPSSGAYAPLPRKLREKVDDLVVLHMREAADR